MTKRKSIKELKNEMVREIYAFEQANDPKEKYKIESKICRIAGRLGDYSLINGNLAMYQPTIENHEGYRIPKLNTLIDQDDLWKITLESRVNGKGNFYLDSIQLIPSKIIE